MNTDNNLYRFIPEKLSANSKNDPDRPVVYIKTVRGRLEPLPQPSLHHITAYIPVKDGESGTWYIDQGGSEIYLKKVEGYFVTKEEYANLPTPTPITHLPPDPNNSPIINRVELEKLGYKFVDIPVTEKTQLTNDEILKLRMPEAEETDDELEKEAAELYPYEGLYSDQPIRNERYHNEINKIRSIHIRTRKMSINLEEQRIASEAWDAAISYTVDCDSSEIVTKPCKETYLSQLNHPEK